MLPLSTDDDGEDAPQPPFMFLRSLKSSNSNYYEPVPGWPRRRWRILRAQPIELPTLRDRSHSPWRARRRRIIRQLLMAILLVAFTLLVLIHQFFRAHGYRKEDAVETFRRLFRPSTLVFDQRELRRVWEWEILSGHYPSRRTVPEQIGLRFQPKHLPRQYLDVQSVVPYPRRPLPGSVADFDIIMGVCDFDTNKYARDCLEFLAAGAGLSGHTSMVSRSKYIYTERNVLRRRSELELEPHLHLHPTVTRRLEETEYGRCDTNHPRIFHTFWTGPLTDKGYVSLLSFLYTQNLGLHHPNDSTPSDACQPQMWVWMDLNPASPMPPPNGHALLKEQLESNMWSAPFLHPRFRHHIHFKLWNATEQLDATPEVKDDWRNFPLLVSLGTRLYPENDEGWVGAVLSDLARFILLHRYGGIYADGDVIFLRDWEELWGWRGAFSYRWSVHDQYNTAVLRLNKGSALGSLLLRTVVRNGWDFHPFTISQFLRDAHSSDLLYRLPDALFDPNWLHFEGQQRDRPPEPYFNDFKFFSTPHTADPPSHFNKFFRGAFGYHSHLTRSRSFDPTRNWPDLDSQYDDDRGSRDPEKDLTWSAVLKRTFESYIRGDQPNMYGERIQWE